MEGPRHGRPLDLTPQQAQPPTFRPFGALTPWLAALAGVYLFVSIVNHLAAGSGRPVLEGSLAFATFPVAIALAVLVSIWFYRAGENADELGAVGRRWAPVWGILGWVIPVANVLLPYLYTREIWKASQPKAGPTDWHDEEVPGWFNLWWVCWGGSQALALMVGIGGLVIGLSNAFQAAAVGAADPVVALPAWLEILGWVQLGLVVLAYPLFVKLLYALQDRQQSRGQRLRALQEKAIPHPPTGTF